MKDTHDSLKKEIEVLKIKILSKLHLNPGLPCVINSFCTQFEAPIHYICSALADLIKEGRVVACENGPSVHAALSEKEIKSGMISDPEVTKLREEFRDLSKKDKEIHRIAKEERRVKQAKLALNKGASGRRKLTIIDPSGLSHKVTNLSKFCNDRGLNRGAMYKLSYGEGHQHKGYSIE